MSTFAPATVYQRQAGPAENPRDNLFAAWQLVAKVPGAMFDDKPLGQVWRFQRRIWSSLRWRARPTGRGGLQPSRTRIFQTCPGW